MNIASQLFAPGADVIKRETLQKERKISAPAEINQSPDDEYNTDAPIDQQRRQHSKYVLFSAKGVREAERQLLEPLHKYFRVQNFFTRALQVVPIQNKHHVESVRETVFLKKDKEKQSRKYTRLVSNYVSGCFLTHCCPAMPIGNRKNIYEVLFSSVLSQFKKYHPPGNLKFNYLGIFQSLKSRNLMN